MSHDQKMIYALAFAIGAVLGPIFGYAAASSAVTNYIPPEMWVLDPIRFGWWIWSFFFGILGLGVLQLVHLTRRPWQ